MENSVCPYLQREKIEAKATRKKKKECYWTSAITIFMKSQQTTKGKQRK